MYSILVELSPVLVERSSASASTGAPIAQAIVAPALAPVLWRAHQLSPPSHSVTTSGFAALDAELPGSGWPHRVLTELLLPHPGLGELRLLVPALARIAGANDGPQQGGRSVMLFDPPAALCGPALVQLGVDARQLLVVYGREGARAAAGLRRRLPSADLLWALEQALKSGHVGAVLAWLPQRLKADALRRLQLAAQSHDGPAFLFREVDARVKPSAAPLRLLLQGAGIDQLLVRVLKRRGPPLARPLMLALPPILSERLRARARGEPAPVMAAAAAGQAAPTSVVD
ncbi:MAG TPA: translesion DNA synthesis-associated protein ImuA [Burkholderiaceae bacterium]